MVQRKVNAAKEYPAEAREAGQEGQVRVSFSIRRDGQPEQVRVAQSSGHTNLDEAATATIRRAAPFLPYPTSVTASAIRVTVTVTFRLK
jgi:protein TonB